MRKPDWLKVPLPTSRAFIDMQGLLGRLALHSVCHEARCPNIGECYGSGTATFLILRQFGSKPTLPGSILLWART